MTKPTVILVHGFRGTPQIPKWYTWLRKELTALGCTVMAPQFPNPEKPRVKDWNKTFEKKLGGDFEDVIFVCHSLGGLAALHAIQSHDKEQMAKSVIFVGVPSQDVGISAIKEFLPPLDWPKIRQRVHDFTFLYSHDDPYVPFPHGEELQDKLGGRMVAFQEFGHFQHQKAFPEVLEIIRDL
ncbi:alpha/beta hydrolase [Candidatus Peregrinibacteria bacterium]|nr:alpha/beta hydrolase [Candidatus Peregrinibacteria bacterium]